MAILIIFDLDGTLFQTAECVDKAIACLFESLNLPPVDKNIINRNIGKTTNEFLNNILPEYINPDDVTEHFRSLEQNEVKEHGTLFPGTVEMLYELKSNGHSLCICSNGSMEYINLVLVSTGIARFFCEKYSAKNYKSKSDLVTEIINNDKKAVLVGDTFTDIEAAQKNKIPSIAVPYGYGTKNDIKEATYIADNATDIADYIFQLDVFFEITEKLTLNNNRIIGINGVDTSGKTKFTENYSRFLDNIGIKNTVIHIDNFHNPQRIRECGENEIDAYYNNAFNYKQLIDEILNPVRESGHIDKDILCLNLDTDKYENKIHYYINNETIVLLEGVLLFRPPISEHLDMKVFLHIDFDEVLTRAAIRDVPKYGETILEKYNNKYIPVQKRYLDEYKPE